MINIDNDNFGIYIHIPFCRQKCYYCDFLSFANCENKIDDYVNRLIEQIKIKEFDLIDNNNNNINNNSESIKYGKNYYNINLNNKKVTSIFIGGGTPSQIDEKYIEKILTEVWKNYNVSDNCEITIEANPGTVDRKKLEKYKEIGINRISFGLQTTNDKLLKLIGRIHTYDQFKENYMIAKQMGFNINIDFIIGLPDQTLDDINNQIEEIKKLDPEHISVYSLILEDGTYLSKAINDRKLNLPSQELERKMYKKMKDELEKLGYIHYEISNFAKPSFKSIHNSNCWKQKQYIGFGLGASSFVNNFRFSNDKDMDNYINGNLKNKKFNYIIEEELSDFELAKEYMMICFRLIDGININEFKKKFNISPLFLFKDELNELEDMGLISISKNKICLTNIGIDFANLVFEKFI